MNADEHENYPRESSSIRADLGGLITRMMQLSGKIKP